jgi:hypothetical protein
MLDVVHQYSRKYRFKFNQDKSNIMIFGRKGKQKFYLGKSELKVVPKYKYLGLVLDNKFTWSEQLKNVYEKARKRMKALCGLGLKKGVSAKAMLRGWEVLVRPILEYGAEVWGEKKWVAGERLQREMGRRVLGVSKMTTNQVVQGELGLSSVRSRRILLRIRFWRKIINMKENRLIYQIYKARREEFINGGKRDKKNWCYWTWQALKELHLEHVWESEKIPEVSTFNKLVSKLMKRKEESEWQDEMTKKSKLRLYRQIKTRLKLEEYVVELDREKRRHLTMLRGGTNNLRIDVGRRRNLREEERTCQACLSEEVEDEKHFLLRCPMYVRERVQMFGRIAQECELEYVETR